MQSRPPTHRRIAQIVAMATCGVVALVGCTKSTNSTKGGASPTSNPPTTIVVTPAAASTGVALDSTPNVIVERGRITAVNLAAPGGQPISGQITPDGHAWMASPGLSPNTTYSGTVSVTGDDGKTKSEPWSFTTAKPAKELHTAALNVAEGGTYGVGMPVVVKLNSAIPADKRAAVEQRMTVTTTPAVTGAWRWVSSTEAHWRPSVYWPAGTKAVLKLDFTGLDAGGGVWGVDARTVNFSIGDSHISVVNAATHQMAVATNGQVVKTVPVSTGDSKYPTKSGIHVVNERSQKVIMDSATVGIPRDSPDGYYETVYWDVRISNSGEFVHAAPWSTGSQGRSNVSHGCVNVSPTDAEWFFNYSRPGDVVQVTNTPATLEPTNGYGDWQVPWAQWAN